MAEKNKNMIENDQKVTDKGLWRDLTAFFLIGLCNNFGFIIMLSSAHDIIGQFYATNANVTNHNDSLSNEINGRDCNNVSTGTILLADVLPAIVLKLLLPYLPFWLHVRMFFAVFCSAVSFLLVGLAKFAWMAVLGVMMASTSTGIAEVTILSYSAMFNKNVISTYSSGTGIGSLIASLTYAILLGSKMNLKNTMYIMLIVPGMQASIFWLLLRKPRNTNKQSSAATTTIKKDMPNNDDPDDKPLTTFKEKFSYMRYLLRYIVPFFSEFFFEYFINQGLYELVYFKNIFLDKDAQYRWLYGIYQIGNFISRSSVNLVHFHKIWILALLQFGTVIYFLIEVIICCTPTIWIVFVVALWEGLLGGAIYVNTFYRLTNEVPLIKQQVAIALISQFDCFGVLLAAFVALPVHDAICELPPCKKHIA